MQITAHAHTHTHTYTIYHSQHSHTHKHTHTHTNKQMVREFVVWSVGLKKKIVSNTRKTHTVKGENGMRFSLEMLK